LALQVFLLISGGYWFVISFFGFGKAERLSEKAPEKRFLVLVPAHNEEKVISNLIENLMELDYPKELYEVCVIADNCTDRTAAIAGRFDATVLEHTSLPGESKGKPYAIKYALDEFGERLLQDYDAFAVFDADNLVTLNYLSEMNNHLCHGDRLIQCYLDSKNPNDNFITLGYAGSYYYMNRAWQLSKYRLGLGNQIGGTGFCVATEVLSEVGWTTRSLTEDLEFTTQCLLKGIRTTWSHQARVYDEKPESFKASCIQRLRWTRGHWDICIRYVGSLLKRFVTKGDILAFEGALYLLNPARILLEAMTWVLWITFFLFRQNFFYLYPLWLWLPLSVLSYFYVVYACSADAEVKFNRIKVILCVAFLNITYIPLIFWGLMTHKDRTWVRTEHSKNITIDDHNAFEVSKVMSAVEEPEETESDCVVA